MFDYVRDPTPHDNFGGVALRGWSGQMCDLSNLWVSFLFSFFLLSSRAQVAFLDRSERSIRHNACFRPRMCLLGVATISDYIKGVKSPKKTSPKWAGIGTSQPNRRSSNYTGHRWRYACNFSHRDWLQGPFSKKSKIWSNGVMRGSRGLLLKFWDPLHISRKVEARNFKFGTEIDDNKY